MTEMFHPGKTHGRGSTLERMDRAEDLVNCIPVRALLEKEEVHDQILMVLTGFCHKQPAIRLEFRHRQFPPS